MPSFHEMVLAIEPPTEGYLEEFAQIVLDTHPD